MPFIVYWPGRVPRARVMDLPVVSVDIFPTLLELAGVDEVSPMDGRSLVPLLTGDAPEDWRTSFLIEYNTDTVFPRVLMMGYKALRTDRWKYIRYNKLAGMDEL